MSDRPESESSAEHDDDIPGTKLPSGRVSLDFSGPPLAAPRSGDGQDSIFPIPKPTRTLSSAPPRGAHDAWIRDKARRSTVDEDSVLAQLSARYEQHEKESLRPGAMTDGQAELGRVEAEEGPDALGLVARRRPSYPTPDNGEEMRERFALGDFTAALRAAEMILGRNPDHAEALKTRAAARSRLEELYRSRLGSGHMVARVVVPDSEVRWLGLDHEAAYLLSRIDGALDLESLLDICGMDRLDALKALTLLVESRAIELQRDSPC